MSQDKEPKYCSFCARSHLEIDGVMISGPDANICSRCVKECVEVVFEHLEIRGRKTEKEAE